VVVIDHKIFFLLVSPIGVESDASVDKLVLATLITLESLAPNLLLTVDQTILVTMVVEVYLADTTINLNDLLPVVG
jgi:hypothetical protein